MNIIKVECLPLSIFVGYERENDARGVAFDYSAWTEQYGDGVLQLLVQRPGDADPYPVVLTAGEDGTAVWSPSATDTAAKGWVEIQLIFMVGSVVAKTAVLQALVDRSLTAGSTPPDPYETWLETLTELGSEAQQAAETAEHQALKSEGFAVGKQNGVVVGHDSPYFENNAEFYASVAQQAAAEGGWVHFYIDENGYLHYVKTPDVDLVFTLVDGYLHVTI